MKSNRNNYLLFQLLMITITLIASIVVHANSYQIAITTTVSPVLTGQNIFFVVPLSPQYPITLQNYYIINQYGYYVYSYLFSTTPPLVVLYEPSATNNTFYVTYGNGITQQEVSTSVFSNLFNFYIFNTSIWNATNVAPSAGLLVFSNNSHLYFQPNEVRYQPPSVLFLYNLLPSGALSLPKFSASGTFKGGTVVFFSLFTTPQQIQFPVSYLASFQSEVVYTPALYSQTLRINASLLQEYPEPQQSIKYFGNFSLSLNGLSIGNNQYPAPSFYSGETFSTSSIEVFSSSSTVQGNTVVGQASLIFTPSMINGSSFIAYENGSIVNVGSATSQLALASNPEMFVVPGSSPTGFMTLYDIPVGSIISVTYLNGSSASFTANGPTVNTIGPIKLTNYQIPAGGGIASFSVNTPETSVNYVADIGFTDFVHTYYVNITNGYATVDINGTILDRLGPVTFPLDIAIGVQSNQNQQAIVGLIYTETGTEYTFLIPSPYTIYNVVPYMAYTTYTGQQLFLSQIGVTLANGLYYQLVGSVQTSISLPYSVSADILNLVTSPGSAIVIGGNGQIYTETLSNTTSSLTIIGATGYQLTLVYQNVQQTTTISQNVYSVSIPQNTPILIAIDPTTRTVSINANNQQQAIPYLNKIVNASLTSTSGNNGISPPPIQPANLLSAYKVNLGSSSFIGIMVYYFGGALFIYLVQRNLQLTQVAWYGTMIWALLSIFIGFMTGMYALLPGAVLGLAVAYILKYLNK